MIGRLVELARDWRYSCQPNFVGKDLARQIRDLGKLKQNGAGVVGGGMKYYYHGWKSVSFKGLNSVIAAGRFEDVLGIVGGELESFCDLRVRKGIARYSFVFRAGDNLERLWKNVRMSGELTYDFDVSKNEMWDGDLEVKFK